MLDQAILDEILVSDGDIGGLKKRYFRSLTKELIKFIEHDYEYKKLMGDLKNAKALNDKLQKRKDVIHQERIQRAALEGKLAAAYTEVGELKDANIKLNQTVTELKALPVRSQRKLETMKTLINEMRAEIKRLQPKDEVLESSVELDESSETGVFPAPKMFNAKVAIFGGYREACASQFPNVQTMTGYENPDEFGVLIKNSDIAVVLTQHIGHSSMWAIKAFCAVYGKPVWFSTHTNIPVILQEAAKLI